ncbi:MAG: hypothetical protein ACREXS_06805 [Gammaproteobacteria bacterium]
MLRIQSAFQRRQARHAASLYYASALQDFRIGQGLSGRFQVQASKNYLAVSSDPVSGGQVNPLGEPPLV